MYSCSCCWSVLRLLELACSHFPLYDDCNSHFTSHILFINPRIIVDIIIILADEYA